jgi:hypothetical protein
LRQGPVALRPFPVEFALRLFPSWAPLPLAIATTLAHFAYGVAAAVLFSFLARPMTAGRGLAFGVALWIVMQICYVPAFLGWMEFGLGRGEPWSALFTLLLHGVYGSVLGALGARDERAHHARFDALDRLEVV